MAAKLKVKGMIEPEVKAVHEYIEPRLVDYSGDTTKEWYIIYYIWHINKKTKVRKRRRVVGDTAKIRYAIAKKEIKELQELLIKGATVGKLPEKPKLIREVDIDVLTFEAAIAHAIEKKKSSLKKNTNYSYQSFFNNMKGWIKRYNYNGLLLKDVNQSIVYEFLDYLKAVRKVSNKSYNNYLGYLSTICNWYYKREYILKNPCLNIEKLYTISGGFKPYSNGQIALIKNKILEVGDKQLLLFIQFVYYTLARPREEVRELKIENILEKTIYIPGKLSKNRIGAHVIIPEPLEQLIQEYKLREYPPHFYIFGEKKQPAAKRAGRDYLYKRHCKILKSLNMNG